MKDSNNVNFQSSISYYADGTIVPDILTQHDAIKFLRLDTDNIKNPKATLKYYRDKGQLRGARIGNNYCYTKKELLNFIEEATNWTNRKTA